MQDKNNAPAANPLAPYVHDNLIIPRLAATTKQGIIEELLDALDDAGLVRSHEGALRALVAREKLLPTAMERGIAIPHARTDAVDALICAFGFSPTGVAFDAIDGKPSQVFIMMLSPIGTTTPQIQIMALILKALSRVGCERLLQASSPDEIRSLLLKGAEEETLR